MRVQMVHRRQAGMERRWRWESIEHPEELLLKLLLLLKLMLLHRGRHRLELGLQRRHDYCRNRLRRRARGS